jgi:hypothetical protein
MKLDPLKSQVGLFLSRGVISPDADRNWRENDPYSGDMSIVLRVFVTVLNSKESSKANISK